MPSEEIFTIIPSLSFGGHSYSDVEVILGRYGNDTLAVQLYTRDNLDWAELLTTVSVNLEAYGIIPTQPDSFYVKSYSENDGLWEALMEAGAIRPTGEIAIFGPYSIVAWEATLVSKSYDEARAESINEAHDQAIAEGDQH